MWGGKEKGIDLQAFVFVLGGGRARGSIEGRGEALNVKKRIDKFLVRLSKKERKNHPPLRRLALERAPAQELGGTGHVPDSRTRNVMRRELLACPTYRGCYKERGLAGGIKRGGAAIRSCVEARNCVSRRGGILSGRSGGKKR